MRNKSWSWLVTSALGLLGVAVLGTGFLLAVVGPRGESAAALPNQESQPAVVAVDPNNKQSADAKPYLIVALGDSLTKGVGDKDGKGYVGYLKDKLETDKQKVAVQNLGISGLESGELVKSVQNGGIQALIKEAKLITISIGGNDLTHSVGNVQTVLQTGKIDEEKIRQATAAYTKNINEILKVVRAHNSEAPVLLVGLYNPFEGVFDDKGKLDQLLTEWNANVVQLVQTYPNVKVVPTFDIFQWNNDRYLSLDHFHPNESGYQRMAERMAQAMPARFLP
ncbi:MAG: SGNH/GDSL hydrolase family protein [Tumebacillaceae bacterium]